jgi:hypothetical protein
MIYEIKINFASNFDYKGYEKCSINYSAGVLDQSAKKVIYNTLPIDPFNLSFHDVYLFQVDI